MAVAHACMPLIPAFGSQRREDVCEFEDSQSYTEKPFSENKQTKENCCLFLLILEEATHCVLVCEPPLGVGVGDNTVALFSAKAKSSEHREKRLFSVTEKTSVSFCIFFFFLA